MIIQKSCPLDVDPIPLCAMIYLRTTTQPAIWKNYDSVSLQADNEHSIPCHLYLVTKLTADEGDVIVYRNTSVHRVEDTNPEGYICTGLKGRIKFDHCLFVAATTDALLDLPVIPDVLVWQYVDLAGRSKAICISL